MNLKEFREKNRITQDELSKEINVSKSYISKIESGFQNPSFEFIKKIKNRYPWVNIDEMFFTN